MVLERKLKNSAIQIQLDDDGNYSIKRPELKGMVLSGGGARGIAYVGMYHTLYNAGAIDTLSHVAGASAGAMTASLVALATHPDDFETITTKLDISKLIKFKIRSGRDDGSRFRNVLEVLYFFQMKNLFKEIDPSQLSDSQQKDYAALKIKIGIYQEVLKKFNESASIKINNLQDLIKFVGSNNNADDNFKQLNNAINTIPKTAVRGENSRFTFGDLKRLRDVLPTDKKHMVKHLSVGVTNKKERAQVIYNEDNAKDQSIAEKVMQSGAHPLMFRAQKDEHNQVFTDGAVLDNMPSGALENLGLQKTEILSVKVNQSSQVEAQLKQIKSRSVEKATFGQSAFDFFLSPVLGGAYKKSSINTREREKAYYDVGNMLFLNCGEIGTTEISPSLEKKNIAINNAKVDTQDLLNERNMQFTDLLDALLYVGEDELHDLLKNEQVTQDSELFKMACCAQTIMNYQKSIVALLSKGSLSASERVEIRDNIDAIEWLIREVYNMHNHAAKDVLKPLALCVKQVDYTSNGKLTDFLNDEFKINPSNANWAAKMLSLIKTPFVWLSRIFSSNEPAVTEDSDNNIEQLEKLKTILAGGERIFDTEPATTLNIDSP